jgi:putative ABC transport system substrate-binding protein
VRRRQFIGALGATAFLWPHYALAQQAGKLPTIGFLSGLAPSATGLWVANFVGRLRGLGWVEGRTVAIEYRWLNGHFDRADAVAAELVRLKIDVAVTHATAPILALKNATSVIPIVFAVANDPIGTGLVASLGRPGGNITGLSLQQVDLAGKRLELLRDVVPHLRRLAIIANAGNPGALAEMGEIRDAARNIGLDTQLLEIQRPEDITPGIDAIAGRTEALYVCGDALLTTYRIRLNTLTLGARLPTMHSIRESVEAGGLMSYGPHFPDLFRRASEYVDKILRGANPADLPVEQPTKFELVFNRTTAKALGIEIPSRLLFTADEVIE